MKRHTILVVMSLLTILFTTFHLADDIVRGMFPGGLQNVPIMLVLVVWLYATLVLAERRSAYVIILVLSLLATGLPILHMMNKAGAVGPRIAGSRGAFFFVWTLVALGVTAIFSVILSARALRSLRRSQAT